MFTVTLFIIKKNWKNLSLHNTKMDKQVWNS